MSKKLRWMFAFVAAFALIAGACGSDDDADTADATTTTADADAGDDDETTTTAAAADETTTAAPADEAGSGVVGFMALGDSVPFSKLVSDSAIREAEAAGMDLVFCDAELDAGVALECARLFAQRDVEVVLNFQVDQASSPEICAAYGDVPTIAIDIIQEPCQVAFMGADSATAGSLGGEALGQFISDEFGCEYDAYVSLESAAAGEANRLRMGGYRDGFTKHCEILNERILDGADRTDTGLEAVTDLLQALPGERIVVVSINEDGILGAMAAARTLGRDGDLYYSGQGTDPSIWCEVKNNPNYIASVAYFPERYGELLIPAAQKLLNGEEIEETLFTPHEPINADNIDDHYDVTDCG
jgi:ribose transport system substrate-binding protein